MTRSTCISGSLKMNGMSFSILTVVFYSHFKKVSMIFHGETTFTSQIPIYERDNLYILNIICRAYPKSRVHFLFLISFLI